MSDFIACHPIALLVWLEEVTSVRKQLFITIVKPKAKVSDIITEREFTVTVPFCIEYSNHPTLEVNIFNTKVASLRYPETTAVNEAKKCGKQHILERISFGWTDFCVNGFKKEPQLFI